MRRPPHIVRRCLSFAASALAVLALSSSAQASEPDTIDGEPFDPSIFGGAPSATCGWPTTVQVNGGCTGTLIHPEVVISAAHCFNGNVSNGTFGFGPQANSRQRSGTCYSKPDYNGSATNDFAYCILDQSVDDVPIIPPLFGCEVDDYINPGQEVTIVGYGNTDGGVFGVKYEVTTTITNFQNGEVFIGGNGLDSCQGDSGGPVFVQTDGGSWRVFGITSYGGACGGGGVYGNMATNLAWAEQQSGYDLTPCFDSGGNWTPNPECGGFPIVPASGEGTTWSEGCSGGAGATVSGFESTCGSPFTPQGDDQPPGVTITSPADGSTYMTGGEGTVAVTITANAGDGDGFGVEMVSLLVNGDPLPDTDDTTEPYEWELNFPAGSWSIQAVANDFSQNVGMSNVVTIGVDQEPEPPPPPPPETGEGSGEGSGEDSGSDSDTDSGSGSGGSTTGWVPGGGDPGIDDDAGCNCTATPSDDGRAPVGTLLALLGLLGLTRGRRRP